jgi:hypothetical protein
VLDVEGRPPYPEGAGGMVGWRYVTPGYFAAMGIPIVRGRAFTEEERNAKEMPIVLSRELARRLFPDGDALGRHMLSTDGVWHTVVGIAGDVINNGLDHHPDPEYYELRKHFADATYNNRAPGRLARGDGDRAQSAVAANDGQDAAQGLSRIWIPPCR